MLLAVLLACADGTIRYPTGTDSIRAALFATQDDPIYDNVTQAVVLLANSEFDCDRIPTLDESNQSLDNVADLAAFTRENARVVVLYLYKLGSAGWVGHYEVEADHSGELVSTGHGRAGAAYLGVEEAVLLDENGLQRLYQPGTGPGDCTLVADVGEPGEVEITKEGNRLTGTFDLDTVDVSGRFHAEECTTNDNFISTFQSILLLQNELTMCLDPADTKAEQPVN